MLAKADTLRPCEPTKICSTKEVLITISIKEALAGDIKKNDSRSKDQGYESSLMAKFVNKSHHYAGTPAPYQNKDNI